MIDQDISIKDTRKTIIKTYLFEIKNLKKEIYNLNEINLLLNGKIKELEHNIKCMEIGRAHV